MEIIGGQVQHWGESGKLSSCRLTEKYAILHRIATGNWVPTQNTSTIPTGLEIFIVAIGIERMFDY